MKLAILVTVMFAQLFVIHVRKFNGLHVKKWIIRLSEVVFWRYKRQLYTAFADLRKSIISLLFYNYLL